MVVIVKDLAVLPDATVAVEGTTAAPLLLLKLTAIPDPPAAPLSFTVPVVVAVPGTLLGTTVTVVKTGAR